MPRSIGGACYIVVLAITFTGLVVAGTSDWRAGIRIITGALALAAVLRLGLPEKDAGMLAVRHRLLDVAILLLIGGALFVLALTIPDQPA